MPKLLAGDMKDVQILTLKKRFGLRINLIIVVNGSF